jgi:hypothetical protein
VLPVYLVAMIEWSVAHYEEAERFTLDVLTGPFCPGSERNG